MPSAADAATGERAAAPAGGGFEAGLVASQDRDLFGRERLRALGPVFEHRPGDGGAGFLAFRPFFSDSADPANHVSRQDWLWPVGVSRQMYDELSWRFLLAYGTDFDRTTPGSRYRFVIFPIVFAGRDKEGHGYGSVFPLGGTVNEFLGQDRIFFVLFPLYARSSLRDLETHNILWPILSWTRGDDVSKFRLFPFYGRSIKGGEQESRFILWPIWTSQSRTRAGSEGSAHMLFPLFGHATNRTHETWMVIPPFFRWSRTEQGGSGCCPWPFVRWSSGDTDQLYLWPLWGRKEEGNVRESFWAWPFVRSYHAARRDGDLSTFRVLPFVHYEQRVAPPERVAGGGTPATSAEGPSPGGDVSARAGGEGQVAARYLQLWPLLSYSREGAAARLRLLDLWPVKDTPGIERNWAPFWTLYCRRSVGGATEQELLWGLFRQRRVEQGERRLSLFPLYSSCDSGGPSPRIRRSFLLGLVGYEKEGMHTAWRLLYWFKVGEQRAAADAAAAGGARKP
jgi:hypothetical protein